MAQPTSSTPPFTPMLQPEQHLLLADSLRQNAGQPGFPDKDKAERMALNHEQVAAMIARRVSAPSEASLAPAMTPTVPQS